MQLKFKFADVLPANDPVAHWIVKLAMIHNDLVYANNNLLAAQKKSIEWFYWYRYAIAHYHEAMSCLAEEQAIPEVEAFVDSLSEAAKALHDEALAIHAEVEQHVSRVRNEATFHYPGEQAKKVLTRALEALADATGTIDSGEHNKVKDARLHYADDVVATLFYRAMGDDEKIDHVTARMAQGEKSLMQFINHAQDEFFVQELQQP